MTDKRPDYEDDVKDITGAFGGAVDDIKRELEQMPLDRRGANAAAKKVGGILKALTGKASSWVDRVIPKAAKEGVSRALSALGIGKKTEEQPVNRVNSELISATSEDTYADLLAVTKNIDRRTKAAIRRAVADAMRANLEAGVNGRRTINADTIANIRRELGAAADNAIIDAAGRRWKVETYVDMVTRTRAMQTQIDATINESLARGVRYGVISKHGAKDACGRWEGRIVKLVRDADGPYPFIGDLPRREIFHPNCRHVISPVRDPKEEGNYLRGADQSVGVYDEEFAKLKYGKKVQKALDEIEKTFGADYFALTKALFDELNIGQLSDNETLGMFKAQGNGKKNILELNKNLGNSKIMANTILHELRHYRHFKKLGLSASQWNKLDVNYLERFATSTNLNTAKRLGLSEEDTAIFRNYYDYYVGGGSK
jgi:hypothetical protein